MTETERALREAAQQVVDECTPFQPPSNGAVERLRVALAKYEIATIWDTISQRARAAGGT